MLRYLTRLYERLNQGGFDPSSPLFNLVIKAKNAIHDLAVELHYESCRQGVNRPDKE
jgi:hypothetical protein